MIRFLGALLFAFLPALAPADLTRDKSTGVYTGFVQVRADRELYVEYTRPTKGSPTVILLNGLTYSTAQFDGLHDALVKKGLGVLRFDFDGMGQTLLKYAPSVKMYPVKQQATDLHQLLRALKIKGPYNLAGLSYGGGVGIAYALQYPDDIENLILMAPFTEPLKAQDDWIKSQIWATRQTFPYNPSTDDQLYDYFLRQIIYSTYPQAEPSILENPYKLEAVFNLARGIRTFKPVDYAENLAEINIHMMVSGKDQYIPRAVLQSFWDKVNPAAKKSRIMVQNVEHKMNEAAPRYVAAWINEIVTGNPLLFKGWDFAGDPRDGSARSESGQVIPLGN